MVAVGGLRGVARLCGAAAGGNVSAVVVAGFERLYSAQGVPVLVVM